MARAALPYGPTTHISVTHSRTHSHSLTATTTVPTQLPTLGPVPYPTTPHHTSCPAPIAALIP
ncbi:uncharacterized protein K452DRAFT_292069 [Aplosporella prunicola CBS 121167]|uniref:Uncharacterized protein n=1 Tax=Aplosporella prunicola CBS 121167 TaxID=1176127 RepID=A0A6A6AYZ4_9PEZI|nr:uncharacterized protein K452DRAFT_292069 [Aplosporella prunicola CBS 121167]KAF2136846.1 hypothetical protein K452DRAFT_292069 [Aplosporella prunicola CBS 121167]